MSDENPVAAPDPDAPPAESAVDEVKRLAAAAEEKHKALTLERLEPQVDQVAALLQRVCATPGHARVAAELLKARGSMKSNAADELVIQNPAGEWLPPNEKTLREILPREIQSAVGANGLGTKGNLRPVRQRPKLDLSRIDDAAYFKEHKPEILAALGHGKGNR